MHNIPVTSVMTDHPPFRVGLDHLSSFLFLFREIKRRTIDITMIANEIGYIAILKISANELFLYSDVTSRK